MKVMFRLCQRPPELSSVQITWGEAMELTTLQRNRLLELLLEQQDAEVKQLSKASRRR